MFDIFFWKWHIQKYYILVLTNMAIHLVEFVVLNEMDVCVCGGGAVETLINKCSLLFIRNIKAS